MTSFKKYIHPTMSAIDEYCNYAYGFSYKSKQISTYDLGDECTRRSWYKRNGKGLNDFSPDMLRYIESNKLFKKTIIDYLDACGIKVWDQNKYLSFCDSKGQSKIDGVANGVKEAPEKTHLLSIRPLRQKAFDTLKKSGIAQKDYIKIQVDMRLISLDRCLFIAVNRNTDEMHIDRIKLDVKFADAQINKAERIIQLKTPPERIGNGKPSWYQCKMCILKDVCFDEHVASENTDEPSNLWK